MSVDLDMKKIEREAYMSYNEDGLVDIVIGCVFLGWGVLLAVDLPAFVVLLGPVALTMWYSGKRFLTIPRIGVIEPSQKMENRLITLAAFLITLGVIAFLAVLIGVARGSDDLANHSLGMVGLVIAAGMCVAAYLLDAQRLYFYAVLLLVAFAGGEAINTSVSNFDTFILSVVSAGALILLSGLGVLIRFLRKYPLPVIEA